MHTYIDCLNEIFPPGLTVLLPRAMDYLKTNKWTNKHKKKKEENPSTMHEKPPLSCYQDCIRNFQNMLLLLPVEPPQKWKVKALLPKIASTSDTGPREHASFTRTSFPGTRRHPCQLPKEGSDQQCYPDMPTMNHNKNKHGHGNSKGTVVATKDSFLKTFLSRGKPCRVLET